MMRKRVFVRSLNVSLKAGALLGIGAACGVSMDRGNNPLSICPFFCVWWFDRFSDLIPPLRIYRFSFYNRISLFSQKWGIESPALNCYLLHRICEYLFSINHVFSISPHAHKNFLDKRSSGIFFGRTGICGTDASSISRQEPSAPSASFSSLSSWLFTWRSSRSNDRQNAPESRNWLGSCGGAGGGSGIRECESFPSTIAFPQAPDISSSSSGTLSRTTPWSDLLASFFPSISSFLPGHVNRVRRGEVPKPPSLFHLSPLSSSSSFSKSSIDSAFQTNSSPHPTPRTAASFDSVSPQQAFLIPRSSVAPSSPPSLQELLKNKSLIPSLPPLAELSNVITAGAVVDRLHHIVLCLDHCVDSEASLADVYGPASLSLYLLLSHQSPLRDSLFFSLKDLSGVAVAPPITNPLYFLFDKAKNFATTFLSTSRSFLSSSVPTAPSKKTSQHINGVNLSRSGVEKECDGGDAADHDDRADEHLNPITNRMNHLTSSKYSSEQDDGIAMHTDREQRRKSKWASTRGGLNDFANIPESKKSDLLTLQLFHLSLITSHRIYHWLHARDWRLETARRQGQAVSSGQYYFASIPPVAGASFISRFLDGHDSGELSLTRKATEEDVRQGQQLKNHQMQSGMGSGADSFFTLPWSLSRIENGENHSTSSSLLSHLLSMVSLSSMSPHSLPPSAISTVPSTATSQSFLYRLLSILPGNNEDIESDFQNQNQHHHRYPILQPQPPPPSLFNQRGELRKLSFIAGDIMYTLQWWGRRQLNRFNTFLVEQNPHRAALSTERSAIFWGFPFSPSSPLSLSFSSSLFVPEDCTKSYRLMASPSQFTPSDRILNRHPSRAAETAAAALSGLQSISSSNQFCSPSPFPVPSTSVLSIITSFFHSLWRPFSIPFSSLPLSSQSKDDVLISRQPLTGSPGRRSRALSRESPSSSLSTPHPFSTPSLYSSPNNQISISRQQLQSPQLPRRLLEKVWEELAIDEETARHAYSAIWNPSKKVIVGLHPVPSHSCLPESSHYSSFSSSSSTAPLSSSVIRSIEADDINGDVHDSTGVVGRAEGTTSDGQAVCSVSSVDVAGEGRSKSSESMELDEIHQGMAFCTAKGKSSESNSESNSEMMGRRIRLSSCGNRCDSTLMDSEIKDRNSSSVSPLSPSPSSTLSALSISSSTLDPSISPPPGSLFSSFSSLIPSMLSPGASSRQSAVPDLSSPPTSPGDVSGIDMEDGTQQEEESEKKTAPSPSFPKYKLMCDSQNGMLIDGHDGVLTAKSSASSLAAPVSSSSEARTDTKSSWLFWRKSTFSYSSPSQLSKPLSSPGSSSEALPESLASLDAQDRAVPSTSLDCDSTSASTTGETSKVEDVTPDKWVKSNSSWWQAADRLSPSSSSKASSVSLSARQISTEKPCETTASPAPRLTSSLPPDSSLSPGASSARSSSLLSFFWGNSAVPAAAEEVSPHVEMSVKRGSRQRWEARREADIVFGMDGDLELEREEDERKVQWAIDRVDDECRVLSMACRTLIEDINFSHCRLHSMNDRKLATLFNSAVRTPHRLNPFYKAYDDLDLLDIYTPSTLSPTMKRQLLNGLAAVGCLLLLILIEDGWLLLLPRCHKVADVMENHDDSQGLLPAALTSRMRFFWRLLKGGGKDGDSIDKGRVGEEVGFGYNSWVKDGESMDLALTEKLMHRDTRYDADNTTAAGRIHTGYTDHELVGLVGDIPFQNLHDIHEDYRALGILSSVGEEALYSDLSRCNRLGENGIGGKVKTCGVGREVGGDADQQLWIAYLNEQEPYNTSRCAAILPSTNIREINDQTFSESSMDIRNVSAHTMSEAPHSVATAVPSLASSSSVPSSSTGHLLPEAASSLQPSTSLQSSLSPFLSLRSQFIPPLSLPSCEPPSSSVPSLFTTSPLPLTSRGGGHATTSSKEYLAAGGRAVAGGVAALVMAAGRRMGKWLPMITGSSESERFELCTRGTLENNCSPGTDVTLHGKFAHPASSDCASGGLINASGASIRLDRPSLSSRNEEQSLRQSSLNLRPPPQHQNRIEEGHENARIRKASSTNQTFPASARLTPSATLSRATTPPPSFVDPFTAFCHVYATSSGGTTPSGRRHQSIDRGSEGKRTAWGERTISAQLNDGDSVDECGTDYSIMNSEKRPSPPTIVSPCPTESSVPSSSAISSTFSADDSSLVKKKRIPDARDGRRKGNNASVTDLSGACMNGIMSDARPDSCKIADLSDKRKRIHEASRGRDMRVGLDDLSSFRTHTSDAENESTAEADGLVIIGHTGDETGETHAIIAERENSDHLPLSSQSIGSTTINTAGYTTSNSLFLASKEPFRSTQMPLRKIISMESLPSSPTSAQTSSSSSTSSSLSSSPTALPPPCTSSSAPASFSTYRDSKIDDRFSSSCKRSSSSCSDSPIGLSRTKSDSMRGVESDMTFTRNRSSSSKQLETAKREYTAPSRRRMASSFSPLLSESSTSMSSSSASHASSHLSSSFDLPSCPLPSSPTSSLFLSSPSLSSITSSASPFRDVSWPAAANEPSDTFPSSFPSHFYSFYRNQSFPFSSSTSSDPPSCG